MDRWTTLEKFSLLDGEMELLLTPKIAIYNGEKLMDEYQDGSLVLTNHRLIWKNSRNTNILISLSLDFISRVSQKTGFLTSSPKIILFLSPLAITKGKEEKINESSAWTCTICDELNQDPKTIKCFVCGVAKSKSCSPSIAISSSPTSHPMQQQSWNCHVCAWQSPSDDILVCEMCGTPRRKREQSQPQQKEQKSPIITTNNVDEEYVKLSFRGSGASNAMTNFTKQLETVLRKGDWKSVSTNDFRSGAFSTNGPIIGITGLLKKVELGQKESDANLSAAFFDLDALMEKASEMVKLAETINSKLANRTSSEIDLSDVQEKEFRKMLNDLGVSSAITKEGTGSAFHQELAKQLADFVTRLMERKSANGSAHLLSLADVYCVYNRARGANLISPSDLYEAACLFDKLNLSITLERLPSGLLVMKRRSVIDPILERAKTLLPTCTDSIDALILARAENITLSVALMYLRKFDADGSICRDESSSGTRYYKNLFLSN